MPIITSWDDGMSNMGSARAHQYKQTQKHQGMILTDRFICTIFYS
jgi:hypothetical protein